MYSKNIEKKRAGQREKNKNAWRKSDTDDLKEGKK